MELRALKKNANVVRSTILEKGRKFRESRGEFEGGQDQKA